MGQEQNFVLVFSANPYYASVLNMLDRQGTIMRKHLRILEDVSWKMGEKCERLPYILYSSSGPESSDLNFQGWERMSLSD